LSLYLIILHLICREKEELEIFLREGSPQSPMSPIRVKLEESLNKQGKILSLVQLPSRVRVAFVAAGSRHSMALTEDGNVFAWGWGLLGQLGLGETQTVLNPTMIPNLPLPVVAISAGGMHSACIDSAAECYTWGSSRYGQLGQGEEAVKALVKTTPGKVLKDDGEPLLVRSISCGGMHTAAVGTDGELWCWGRADNGQTGSGHWIFNFFSGIVSPHRVEGIVTVDDSPRLVVCGAFHTVVVTTKGRVVTFGKEDFGMLGKANGSGSSPTAIDSLRGEVVVGAACGGWHTLLWTEKGELFVCGKGEYGRLGTGHEESRTEPTRVSIPFPSDDIRVVHASAGGSHSLVLDSAGCVWVVGRTDDGRLGVPGSSESEEDRKKSDRMTVWSALQWEQSEGWQEAMRCGIEGGPLRVAQVAAGGSHSFFLCSNGNGNGNR
jgi:alpha-tubulin suppressor-like RCC1 family protein